MQTITINNYKTEKNIILVLTIWSLLASFAGYRVFFANFPRPVFGFTVITLTISLLLIYRKNSGLQQFIKSIPQKYLALFHAYRIFPGLLFLSYTQLLPKSFAMEAGYGDIITGFIAIIVFVFFQNKKAYWLFHIIGFIDLANAASNGMYLAFSGEPKMIYLLQFPLALIPLVLVPVTMFAHIASMQRLLKEK